MTPMQIKAVQDSFALIAPDRDHVAALFYDQLFQMDPSLRPMFKGEMSDQGRKLMSMLALVIRSLEALGGLVPALKSLGERHRHYGVDDRHYKIVSAALLLTLEKGLGPAFTDHVRGSWEAAYRLISETMLAGARKSCAAA